MGYKPRHKAAIGLAEVIIIGFVIGTNPFREYLNSVSDIKVGSWWDIMIKVQDTEYYFTGGVYHATDHYPSRPIKAKAG